VNVMEMQLLAVYALIGLACLFVARAGYRTWFGKPKGGCGSGCGKCSAPPAEARPSRRVGLPLSK